MKADELRGKIMAHGMTIRKFCEIAGFERSTFDRKLSGKSEFNLSEIRRIRDELSLTNRETCNIFFTDEVT